VSFLVCLKGSTFLDVEAGPDANPAVRQGYPALANLQLQSKCA
jgi:hypothetical protein